MLWFKPHSTEAVCKTCGEQSCADSPLPRTLSNTGKEVVKELLKNHGVESVSDASLNRIADHLYRGLEEVTVPSVTSLEVFVSEACNLSCDYCFIGTKPMLRMSEETGRTAVDFLMRESGSEKELVILFFGGEPLLNFPCIRTIAEYGRETAEAVGKRLRLTITTNGTVINEEIARFFSDYEFSLMLSVDGRPEDHDRHRRTKSGQGSFAWIQENLPLFQRCIPPTKLDIRLTISPDTASHLLENVRFVRNSFDAHRVTVSAAWGVRWTRREYECYRRAVFGLVDWYASQQEPGFELSFLDTQADCAAWGCRAGRQTVAVKATGDLIPCSALYGAPSCGDYVLGNVRDGFVRPDRRAEFMLLTGQRGKECLECSLSGMCAGGCLVGNEKARKNYAKPAPLSCWEAKTTAEIWHRWIERKGLQERYRNTRQWLPYQLGERKQQPRRWKKDEPEISVLMPTYNQAAYVRRAIRSVLSQTFPNWELILVNDCSTDETHRLISGMPKDSRIRYVRNAVNIEEWASVLRAFEMSRGKYIAYLHSDDRWYPNHLDVLYAYLGTHPEKRIAYTAFHCQGRYAKHLEFSGPSSEGERRIHAEEDISGREKELIHYGTFMVPPQVMHHRECLERHKPPTRAEDEQAGLPHVNGDGRLWRKFLTEYDIGFVETPTVEWMIHGNNQHLIELRAGLFDAAIQQGFPQTFLPEVTMENGQQTPCKEI